MQIRVGDSRLEQVATCVSDARAKETEREEQLSLAQNMEEKAKKASSDGVVLEVSKADAEDSYVKQNATKKVEQAEVPDKKQQKEQLQKQQKEQQMTAAAEQRQILENINIS